MKPGSKVGLFLTMVLHNLLMHPGFNIVMFHSDVLPGYRERAMKPMGKLTM